MNYLVQHKFSFCDYCEHSMVICDSCGNNTCNGGYGEVMSQDPEKMMQCPDCPSAYELDQSRFKKVV